MTRPTAISCAAGMSPGYQSDSNLKTVAATLPKRGLPVLHSKTRELVTTSLASQVNHLRPREPGTLGDDFATTLLAMAGHDLGQPLQIITSAHDALLRMLDSEGQRAELAFAVDATARLARMLGQLIEALHLHQHSSESLVGPVKLPPLFKGLAAEFDRQARLRGIKLSFGVASGAAVSDPVLLTGILRNLIRNAINYTPSGGSVSVGCRRRGSDLLIEIRDTGVGIPAGALPKVFKAFERADESRVDGLGLGLFIVKRAADLLGHRVEVRSYERQGSCFRVVARAAFTKCPLHGP
jgi:two-component system phosphate regulon sensor histidine kinase PhoR